VNDDMIVSLPEADRLDKFRELNANPTKVKWDERVDLIRKEFPSTVNLDWERLFAADSAIMGRLVNDILKVDLADRGRPGKRPSIEERAASDRLRQLQGDDYSTLPFAESFRVLADHHHYSTRGLANRLDISHTAVNRLMRGLDSPSIRVIERTAIVFKKDPSYFAEYRLLYVFGVLYRKMELNPEATVGFYRKLKE
jgi:hypothetical protein